VPESPESLPTLEEILGLPNREVTPVEEEDLGLAGLFWLPPDPEDHLHPALTSASATESRRLIKFRAKSRNSPYKRIPD
jgi:hypothetical protein